ncbi:secretin N-terminal domain-containing protein [Pseudanabaena sp. PCC 6802]|uniref:secretin N-terminal domain-containing protein n=1 Tax=Pseudanabaena sp. PCC 6802 TaxID=118173 RepID=UPI00034BDB6C|nr:secretin N-terminal domain-containing protein [Pseudanabaena sp. PCC 6802]
MNRYVFVCWLALATIFPQVIFTAPVRSESATNSEPSSEVREDARDTTNKEKSIVPDLDKQRADKDAKDEAIVAQSKSKPAAKPKPVAATSANKPTPKPAPIATPTSPTIVAQNAGKPLFQPRVTITDERGKPKSTPQASPVSPVQQPSISVTTPSSSTNLRLPGRVQGQVPPFQRRPVPAPIGDISVSNTFLRPDIVDLSSAARVPRLSLKEAPVREVLSIIARTAGLNVAFADDASQQAGQPSTPGLPGQAAGVNSRITLDIENETAQEVFNSVLRLAGLDANRIGRTVFVAAKLPFNLKNTITRTYRMNQVTVGEASAYLIGLGAERVINRQRPIPGVTAANVGAGGVVVQNTPTEAVPVLESVQGSPNSLLPLKGLQVIGDERGNTLMLVGPPSLVEYAAAQLARLDIRKRQVAINVKIVDVNLLASQRFGSSSSFGINDTFFTINQGVATLNFGQNVPAGNVPVTARADNGLYSQPIVNNPLAGQQLFLNPNGTERVRDPVTGNFVNRSPNQPGSVFSPDGNPLTPGINAITQFQNLPANGVQPYSSPTILTNPANGQPVLDTSGNAGVVGRPATYYLNPGGVINANLPGLNPAFKTGPFANTPLLLDPVSGQPVISTAAVAAQAPNSNALLDTIGQAAQFAYSLPQVFQYPKQFLSQLEATIQNGNAKVLSNPTLTVQEGETAALDLGDEVITLATDGRSVTKDTAGLRLSVNITRVDENGFINLSLLPQVSTPGLRRRITIGNNTGGISFDGEVDLLTKRSMSSGQIRLRDGQTLILSGVIQDADRQTISKVPFLGDLPIIGSLFRSESTENRRNEVIIIVTPRIINDSETANWGYIYQPGPEAQKVLDSNRIPFQNQ